MTYALTIAAQDRLRRLMPLLGQHAETSALRWGLGCSFLAIIAEPRHLCANGNMTGVGPAG